MGKQATKQASTPPSGAFGTRVVVGEALRPAKGRPKCSVSPCEGRPARISRHKWSKIGQNRSKNGSKMLKKGSIVSKSRQKGGKITVKMG